MVVRKYILSSASQHTYIQTHTMSLGKTYYRYVQRSTCAVVASPGVNIMYDNTGQLAITGALEQSLAWSIRTGERIHSCRPTSTSARGHPVPGTQVTVQALSPALTQQNRVAVGYEDGGIRINELQSQGTSCNYFLVPIKFIECRVRHPACSIHSADLGCCWSTTAD